MVPYINKSFRINCIEFGSDLFDQAKIEQFTILFRSDVFIFLASIQTEENMKKYIFANEKANPWTPFIPIVVILVFEFGFWRLFN